MAKEQIHNYLRTGVTIAVIVFAGGGWTFQIAGNTSRIAEEKIERVEADKKLLTKTDKLQEDTHLLALNAKDTQALAAKAAEAMVSIETKFAAIQTRLNDQATIQAINSTKLDTLTKD
jgi:hypothetical protein